MQQYSSSIHPSPQSPLQRAAHFQVGKQGEDIAEQFLRGIGYEVRGKNLRLGRDEIDLLAFDPVDHALVFAEVKTRSRQDADYPAHMNAGRRKRINLRRSARRWVTQHAYEGGYRMDLVCVEGGRVTQHIKELSWG